MSPSIIFIVLTAVTLPSVALGAAASLRLQKPHEIRERIVKASRPQPARFEQFSKTLSHEDAVRSGFVRPKRSSFLVAMTPIEAQRLVTEWPGFQSDGMDAQMSGGRFRML